MIKILMDLYSLLITFLIDVIQGDTNLQTRRTFNDLTQTYRVRGEIYNFECHEYMYTLKSVHWFIPDSRYYLYFVIMVKNENVVKGTYPRMNGFGTRFSKHPHHMALRAHIQTYILT